jgi:hypothetical protein
VTSDCQNVTPSEITRSTVGWRCIKSQSEHHSLAISRQRQGQQQQSIIMDRPSWDEDSSEHVAIEIIES